VTGTKIDTTHPPIL